MYEFLNFGFTLGKLINSLYYLLSSTYQPYYLNKHETSTRVKGPPKAWDAPLNKITQGFGVLQSGHIYIWVYWFIAIGRLIRLEIKNSFLIYVSSIWSWIFKIKIKSDPDLYIADVNKYFLSYCPKRVVCCGYICKPFFWRIL